MLQHLFRTDRFARIEEWVHEHSRELRQRSTRDRATVQRLLDSLADRMELSTPEDLSGDLLAQATADGRVLAWARHQSSLATASVRDEAARHGDVDAALRLAVTRHEAAAAPRRAVRPTRRSTSGAAGARGDRRRGRPGRRTSRRGRTSGRLRAAARRAGPGRPCRGGRGGRAGPGPVPGGDGTGRHPPGAARRRGALRPHPDPPVEVHPARGPAPPRGRRAVRGARAGRDPCRAGRCRGGAGRDDPAGGRAARGDRGPDRPARRRACPGGPPGGARPLVVRGPPSAPGSHGTGRRHRRRGPSRGRSS